MFAYKRKKYGIPYYEVWFSRERQDYKEVVPRGNFVRLMQAYYRPLVFMGMLYTPALDITRSNEEILAGFVKKVRQYINSMKDWAVEVKITRKPTFDDVDRVCEFHRKCTEGSTIPQVNKKRLMKLAKKGHLMLSEISMEPLGKVSQYIYIHDGVRVRALHTCNNRSQDSAQNNLIGKLTRYQVWSNIQAFKEMGFEVYDLGGVSGLGDEGVRPGIDKFKREFCENIETTYNGMTVFI